MFSRKPKPKSLLLADQPDAPPGLYKDAAGEFAEIYGGALVARRQMSMIAFLQYLAPSIAFLIGVFVYHEPIDSQRMLGLAAIWTGLAVYSVDQLKVAAVRREAALP